MNALLVFYSRSGNNKYIAERIARDMECEIEEIMPKSKSYFALLASSLLKFGRGNTKAKYEIAGFSKIIVCSPIWMGQVAWPSYCFLKHNKSSMKSVYFVSCCGSNDEDKDSKFGYAQVFDKLRAFMGEKLKKAFGIPIGLNIDKSKLKEMNIMEIRLSDSNFVGDFKAKYDKMIAEIIA